MKLRLGLWASFITLLPAVCDADGFVLGAGRWTCATAIAVYQEGTPVEKGQLAGWIMGYWSAATFSRETSFIGTVERVGAEKIATATIDQCRGADADAMVFRVVQGMISNTK
jgi:hypothetical protein